MSVVWQQHLVNTRLWYCDFCSAVHLSGTHLQAACTKVHADPKHGSTMQDAACDVFCTTSKITWRAQIKISPLFLHQLNPLMPTPLVPHRGNHPNRKHLVWACWLECFVPRKLQDEQTPQRDNADQAQYNPKYTDLGLKHFQIKEMVFVSIRKKTEGQICLEAFVTGAVQVYSHGAMQNSFP